MITLADFIRMQERVTPKASVMFAASDAPTGQKEIGKGGIQDEIEDWLKSLGVRCAWIRQRTDKPTTTKEGTPDFIGAINGFAFALEVKQPGKKPTSAQQAELHRWHCAGAKTAVVHSLAEAKSVLGWLEDSGNQKGTMSRDCRVRLDPNGTELPPIPQDDYAPVWQYMPERQSSADSVGRGHWCWRKEFVGFIGQVSGVMLGPEWADILETRTPHTAPGEKP